VKVDDWRKARALFWVLVTLAFILALFLLTGVIEIPGLPTPRADLSAYRAWVFVILILLATKALLEVLKPVFRAALRGHVRFEADIFAHFKIVSYVVWATALGLTLYVLLGGGEQQFGFLGTAVVSAALIYVMQEPLLNIVGWMVLVTMRLYKLGDRIEMNGCRGYVVGISPMNTTIREFGGLLPGDTFTGRYVTIPNSQALKGNVFNYTKDTPFIWDQLTVSVASDQDVEKAEEILLETAEEIVGPMMRENRERLRSKYEFADLAEYVAEEPRVTWSLRDHLVDLTLVYFCPVFERSQYRTRLVKRLLERAGESGHIKLLAPPIQPSPAAPQPAAAITVSR